MLRIIIAITLLLNSVAIFGDELSDRLREQELLQQQLESAQQRVRQNETRQRQTGTEIQRTASLKRVTDNRLRDLRAQEAVVADSLRSVEQRLELTRDRLQSLKSSLNDQMNMLLRVDRSYRPQGVQHRDQKFISMLSVQTKQEIDVARGYQIVLMQEQETHANEKSKVNASLRQTNNESRNYSRRITNLEAQRGQLTREQRQLQQRIEQLQRDARELQSLINRLMAARGEETVDRFGAGQMAWPVRGRIIRSFGQETREYNTSVVSNGIDIAVAENTTVHAAEAGTVIFADRYGGQGKMVIIDHKNGFFSLYGYCNDLLVTVGTQVRRAQAIAKSGRTGSASEPSLHFEVRRDGRAVNPLTYLQ
jgi:septal ring factor EnvC (AmiA/AmiB activator)